VTATIGGRVEGRDRSPFVEIGGEDPVTVGFESRGKVFGRAFAGPGGEVAVLPARSVPRRQSGRCGVRTRNDPRFGRGSRYFVSDG